MAAAGAGTPPACPDVGGAGWKWDQNDNRTGGAAGDGEEEEGDEDFVPPDPAASGSLGFRADAFRGFLPVEEVPLSDCRELVPVSGGFAEKIRDLSTRFPQFCWEYRAEELMICAEFNVARAQLRKAAHQAPDLETFGETALPADKPATFFSYINRTVSPYEFYSQPKKLEPARLKLNRRLNFVYEDSMLGLLDEQLFVGVPCVTRHKVDGKWYRARVLAAPEGGGKAHIRFVDRGDEQWVEDTEALKPLLLSLARLPPLVLKCRIRGVNINDLYTETVKEFVGLIAELGSVARIQLVTTKEPFLVNLFHPTIHALDLGAKYLPRVPDNPPPAVIRTESEEDLRAEIALDDDSDTEESDAARPPYVLELPRMGRPARERHLTVSYVESTRAIYMRDDYQVGRMREFREALARAYDTPAVPPLSSVHYAEDFPCVVLNGENGEWERVVIRSATEEGFHLQSADGGYYLPFLRMKDAGKLKPLLSDFSEPPNMFQCRLGDFSHELPMVQETDILRRLLPPGTQCFVVFQRRQVPFKISFLSLKREEGGVRDILEEFGAEVRKKLIQRSSSVVPYDASLAAEALKTKTPATVEPFHLLPPCIGFRKGNLRLGEMIPDCY